MKTDLENIQLLLDRFKRPIPNREDYKNRLAEEFELILNQRFTDYFLQICDIIDLTNDLTHMTRGSAGSSLVCYLLGITDVDPIKWNIPVARFMNPLRDDLPDVDIDFQHWQRWLGKRSMSLAMDTAISKGLDSEAGRQYWLVSPKGSQDSTTNYNYSMMRNLRSKKSDIHFWAFRNNAENVRNHLKIRKGDIVMFLMVNTRTLGLEKGHWLDDNPDYPLNVFRWVEYEVKIPYTIDIASDLSTFFEEDDSLNPGNRTWPHFIHLEKLEEGGNLTIKNRGNLSNHFRTSSSPGIRSGGPVRINFELYEELLDALRNEE